MSSLSLYIVLKWLIPFDEDKYQLLKSLSCYNYQCSEGHAIDEHLHKVCESILNEQTYKIVDSLPEYKQAKWE